MLSDSVSTEITTSPLSFPTLVAQLAVLAVDPCNFLQIFLVESIFKTDPYTDVASARSAGSRLHTSLTYTVRNHPGCREGREGSCCFVLGSWLTESLEARPVTLIVSEIAKLPPKPLFAVDLLQVVSA